METLLLLYHVLICIVHVYVTYRAYERGSAGTSIRGQKSHEGVCESLKGLLSLAIYVYSDFVPFCGFFSTIFSLFRKIIM